VADAVKIDGVDTGDIAFIDGVAKADIVKIGTATYPANGVATRWMGGANTGRLFTTTASNGLTGWGDGKGTNGAIIDLGNGDVVSVAYGNSGEDVEDPPRWICGLAQSNGSLGGICYINSSSVLDAAGIPYYATASNWTSASAPVMDDGFQGRQGLAYGNDVWMGATKEKNVSGDYQSFWRSTNYGASWTRLAESNDENDEGEVMCYKGTGNTWMAGHGKSIWRSTDNGANWSRIFTGSYDGSYGTVIFKAIAYDGSGRWMAGGTAGDAWYSDNDGDLWVDQSSRTGTANNIAGMVYMKGSVNRWIIVGQSGMGKSQTNVAIDEDEENWGNIAGLEGTTMNAIATDHVTAIAVGQSGRIWATTNGTSWNLGAAVRADNIGTNALKSIACDIIGAGIYK